ncbi:unnamed protein product [Cyprideis torosa]|uniref:NUC153 domain-containing protein n=1 Tax=Cyprideis torosa TaxID=163714 RepID=A0A7R8ZML3_9CRUS|nr:unnamed protein product [Cyprideis torosa]CAG0894493.1 unnamed protein product [Cyprideis torosa]
MIDKKGRKLEKSNSAWKKPDDDLKRFYRLEEEPGDNAGIRLLAQKLIKKTKKKKKPGSNNSNAEVSQQKETSHCTEGELSDKKGKSKRHSDVSAVDKSTLEEGDGVSAEFRRELLEEVERMRTKLKQPLGVLEDSDESPSMGSSLAPDDEDLEEVIDFGDKESRADTDTQEDDEKSEDEEVDEDDSGSEESDEDEKGREGSSYEDESGEEEEEDESSDESDDELVTGGTKRPDFARGEAELESSSSSEDESVDEEDVVEHPWGELDADAPRGDCGGARRLAVCHMDWDRVNAKDLMVIFSSFVRPGGSVKKVTIYPSEFGKRRMADEERYGPAEFLEDRDDESDDEEEEDDGGEEEDTEDEKMAEKIRRYQLSRLKYFYAIVECDCAGTADALYEECDGKEFESSAARLDLRLVPESETFDEEEARDSCDQLPDVGKYNPKFFITTALQQAKVCCTWDEDDVHRKNLIGQVFEEGANVDALEDDLKAYLGTDSESSEDEEEGGALDDAATTLTGMSVSRRIDKYKRLLDELEVDGDLKDGEKEGGMEVTWEEAEEGGRKEEEVKEEEDDSSGVEDDPFFKPVKKKKKVKKDVKEEEDEGLAQESELALMTMKNEETEGRRKHFSLHKLLKQQKEEEKKADAGGKKKRKLRKKEKGGSAMEAKDEEDQIDVEDPRFNAIYTSHEYNIDPSHPTFKKTKGMLALVNEKRKRRQEGSKEVEGGKKRKTEKKERNWASDSTSFLVAKIKHKSQVMMQGKKKKMMK